MEQTGWALVWVILVFVTDVTVRILAVIFVPRNRRPTAAMAWLLAIYFIPIIGVLLYLLIGTPRLPEGTVLWSGGTEPLSDFEASGHGSTQPCV